MSGFVADAREARKEIAHPTAKIKEQSFSRLETHVSSISLHRTH
jgi:hypothetical protein